MPGNKELVFLFDVDNTLLNNDQVERDLRQHLGSYLGIPARDRFWEIFEELRREIGYADYLQALERYRLEHLHDPRVLRISCWLVDYPFAQRLYPDALNAVRHVHGWGMPVILSDGDAVFQPRKVDRSGLWEVFKGHVLIYVHKEEMLADVERLYPAGHYAMIDDKLRLLAAIKEIWGERVTTVFVRQGHYAEERGALSRYRPADLELDRIGDLLDCRRETFLKGNQGRAKTRGLK